MGDCGCYAREGQSVRHSKCRRKEEGTISLVLFFIECRIGVDNPSYVIRSPGIVVGSPRRDPGT